MRSIIIGLLTVGFSLGTVVGAKAHGEKATTLDFGDSVTPIVKKYCIACHAGQKAKGGVDLASFENEKDAAKKPEVWRRVWDVVRREEMPPKKPQPTMEERAKLLGAVAVILERAASDGGREPGHVVLRRLNQVEYNNTVMDLFGTYRGTRTSGGTPFEPDKGMPEVVRAVLHREARQIVVPLPPENVAYGFTNIGEVLAVPPFLLEKYLAASRQVIDKLVDGQVPRDVRIKKPATEPREAARAWLTGFGQRVLRKQFTADQIQRDPKGVARLESRLARHVRSSGPSVVGGSPARDASGAGRVDALPVQATRPSGVRASRWNVANVPGWPPCAACADRAATGKPIGLLTVQRDFLF